MDFLKLAKKRYACRKYPSPGKWSRRNWTWSSKRAA